MKKTLVFLVALVVFSSVVGVRAYGELNNPSSQTQATLVAPSAVTSTLDPVTRIVYPLPRQQIDEGLIQFNNLTVQSVSGAVPPAEIIATTSYAIQTGAIKPVPEEILPLQGGGTTCVRFPSRESASGTAVPCPLPVSGAGGAPVPPEYRTTSSQIVIPAPQPTPVPLPIPTPYQYRIQVANDTRLFLRNRERASLSDFESGDQINVFGFYNTDGSIQALIVRNLSKPEEKRFVQLEKVELVSIDRNFPVLELTPDRVLPTHPIARLVVVQRPEYPCYDFGVRGDEKRILPCPLGIQKPAENPSLKNLQVPESIAPVWNVARKYLVNIDSQTIILDRNRGRVSVADLAIGDQLNVYGVSSGRSEIIDADIIRDLSKPSKPATPETYKGTITQVNADGSFVIRTEDGRLLTVLSPIQVGATVKIKGVLDELKGVIQQVSEIIAKEKNVVVTPSISIRTSDILTGVVGQVFSATFAASAGNPPYGWSVTAGNLPLGLSFAPLIRACTNCPQPMDQAALQGTPTQAGSFKFQLTVKDQSGNTGSETFVITIRETSSTN